MWLLPTLGSCFYCRIWVICHWKCWKRCWSSLSGWYIPATLKATMIVICMYQADHCRPSVEHLLGLQQSVLTGISRWPGGQIRQQVSGWGISWGNWLNVSALTCFTISTLLSLCICLLVTSQEIGLEEGLSEMTFYVEWNVKSELSHSIIVSVCHWSTFCWNSWEVQAGSWHSSASINQLRKLRYQYQ